MLLIMFSVKSQFQIAFQTKPKLSTEHFLELPPKRLVYAACRSSWSLHYPTLLPLPASSETRMMYSVRVCALFYILCAKLTSFPSVSIIIA